MAGFDIIAIAVIGLATVFGLVKGLFHQFLKALFVVGALAILYFCLPNIEWAMKGAGGATPEMTRYIAVVGIVFAMYIFITVIMYLLRQPIRKVRFGGLDHLLGGVLGFVKGAGLLAAITFALISFPDHNARVTFLKPNIFHNSWAAPRMVVGMQYIKLAFEQQFFVDAEEMLKA